MKRLHDFYIYIFIFYILYCHVFNVFKNSCLNVFTPITDNDNDIDKDAAEEDDDDR